jgi:hypothetical protein
MASPCRTPIHRTNNFTIFSFLLLRPNHYIVLALASSTLTLLLSAGLLLAAPVMTWLRSPPITIQLRVNRRALGNREGDFPRRSAGVGN